MRASSVPSLGRKSGKEVHLPLHVYESSVDTYINFLLSAKVSFLKICNGKKENERDDDGVTMKVVILIMILIGMLCGCSGSEMSG